jgi:hypothetical protein
VDGEASNPCHLAPPSSRPIRCARSACQRLLELSPGYCLSRMLASREGTERQRLVLETYASLRLRPLESFLLWSSSSLARGLHSDLPGLPLPRSLRTVLAAVRSGRPEGGSLRLPRLAEPAGGRATCGGLPPLGLADSRCLAPAPELLVCSPSLCASPR